MYKIEKIDNKYAIFLDSEVLLYGDSEVELKGNVRKMMRDLDMYDDIRKEIVLDIKANIK